MKIFWVQLFIEIEITVPVIITMWQSKIMAVIIPLAFRKTFSK